MSMHIRARRINDTELLQLVEKGLSQKKIAELMNVSPAAICKRLKRLRPEPMPESFRRLTPQRQMFILEKLQGKGNVAAVESAFNVATKESAKSIAKQLMRDDDVRIALADIMAQEGIGRRRRIQRLRYLIEHSDPNVVAKGLEQSWRLDGYKSEEKERPIIMISSEKLMILNQVQQLIEEYQREQRRLKEGEQNQAAETQ